MKNHLIRIAIILSVAFNAATIAGLLYGAYFAKASASTSPDLAPAFKQLNMTPSQKSDLEKSNAAAFRRIVAARDRMRTKWSEGVQLLGQPDLNSAAIQAKQTEIADAQKAYQDLFFQIWIERAQLFTPAQRRELFATVDRQIKAGVFFNWRVPDRNPTPEPKLNEVKR